MAYTSWSVVFGEQPSAAKWNILGSNDAHFNSWITGVRTKVGTFTANGSTGNQSVSGVGFQPKVVEFQQLNTSATTAHFMARGAMDESGNQWAMGTGGNLSNIFRNSSSSKCIMFYSAVTDATPELQATYVSMDSDGFTINLDIASALTVAYIAQA